MQGSFFYHLYLNNKKLHKRFCILAALMSAVFLLSACGPEPGADSSGNPDAGSMFGEQHMEAGSAEGAEKAEEAAASASDTAAAAKPQPVGGDVTKSDEQTLETLEKFLNEDSNYGFLLSSYETPAEIDLNQVFYSGAGFKAGELTEKEKKLLLDRIPQKEIRTPVVKVTDEQIEQLLMSRAGISYEESAHPLEKEDGWAHIGRTGAWYALRGDTNRMYIQCSDAWEQGNSVIVHYRLLPQEPSAEEPAAETAGSSALEGTAAAAEEEKAAAAGTTVTPAADTAATIAADTPAATAGDAAASAAVGEAEAEDAATSDENAAEDTIVDSSDGSAATETVTASAGDTAAHAAVGEAEAEETAASDGSTAADTAATTAEDTAAATAAAGDTAASAASVEVEHPATGEENALYLPTYEAELEKTEDGYRFCYNILWLQKDLIEAQSYKAELKPVGEVFFAPFYPDTEQNVKADVTFALEKDRAICAILSPVETNNIRKDRIFDAVDAVDFTDYNGDGYTDILTVCTYTQISEDGRKAGSIREVRIYTGQKEGVPFLDRDRTEAVNRDVEVLNITNVTDYLTGKNDGKAQKYSSWKEAFADHIEGIAEEEYDGFALVYLNDDRTPELVQIGATTAKGATIVVYRNGTLEETWLNRRDFYYLEYENLLYSPSGVENLHFDTFYSIVGGRLGISTQGYYGNSSFARTRFDKNGKEIRNYFWDGGEVSENGYQDGIAFIFDMTRAKLCEAEQLLTAAELMEKLK